MDKQQNFLQLLSAPGKGYIVNYESRARNMGPSPKGQFKDMITELESDGPVPLLLDVYRCASPTTILDANGMAAKDGANEWKGRGDGSLQNAKKLLGAFRWGMTLDEVNGFRSGLEPFHGPSDGQWCKVAIGDEYHCTDEQSGWKHPGVVLTLHFERRSKGLDLISMQWGDDDHLTNADLADVDLVQANGTLRPSVREMTEKICTLFGKPLPQVGDLPLLASSRIDFPEIDSFVTTAFYPNPKIAKETGNFNIGITTIYIGKLDKKKKTPAHAPAAP